ncbi:iron complex transport system ATP-binding protein [Aliiroseovarius halocynthiae]|uniref:ABC transporter ATP-binding protein n=1 Tax=Aliiroseovarius halocynthiae TaxID=985055 RepID=A0A545SNJ6_9RHOB|nr:ABC transporter ATP-binding protein [Aliiroseovarius halocynthiae]TQV66531.1 ABC transporter ATP-binding protein [Aliiroseovarius halocynthiae]SMR82600.1 iron complex transport system ATP-binding protein [Aliiroseovarius halocynthiae]
MTQDHTLKSENLDVGYDGHRVIKGLNIEIPMGQITAIVGANACGKSTLLRAMSRLLSPMSGQVVLDGKAVHQIPSKELARTLGLLPQSPIAPDGITVADLVGRGRHPYHQLFSRWGGSDDAAVARALDVTQTANLSESSVDELSGGQRQRAWIAMALAQETDILLLDEPTTFLDVSHQVEVLDLLTDLNRDLGTTIVMVLHDLNLATRYADHLIAMKQGQVHATGAPGAVLTVETIREVFALNSEIIVDPVSQKPLMLPIGRYHQGNHHSIKVSA